MFFFKNMLDQNMLVKTVEHSTMMQLVAVMKQDQEKQKV
jgi:hypothetical protein